MRLEELQDRAWTGAEAKGFHIGRTSNRDDTLVRLCLIHSEVSEAVQEVKRHWGPSLKETPLDVVDRVGLELADVLIRCADLASCIGIDLATSVREVLNKNLTRPPGYGTPHEGKREGM